jgi:putative metallopeptidase
MRAPMILPTELTGVAEALTKAVREVELLAEWPAGEAFHTAEQPAAIAKPLIGAVHAHLKPAHIAYLFKEDMKRRDRLLLGKAAKASGVLAFLAGFDFVLVFNWEAWAQLTPPQRIALVDHELAHCEKAEAGWVMVGHDVEEFRSIVGRWGLWTPDLREFHTTASHAQTDLFQETR